MSEIEYEHKYTGVIIGNDKEILQDKIKEVCQKIGFDDFHVKWHIFNPKEGKDIIEKILIGTYGREYGYCNPYSNEIWISTLAIQRRLPDIYRKIDRIIKLDRIQEDFLANVIIDEITHIQTGRDHGSKEYDDALIDNLNMFYKG